MRYEHDFLISYAHIDDQALIAGEQGWVTTLHRLLEIRVGQLRGEVPRIWRDPKLQGNDYFADTILERLPQIAALVSIVSPRYVQSEWCNRELKEFCRAAERSGGLRVADKARVFKVVKTPVQQDRLPDEMRPILGYEFFTYDTQSGRPRELLPAYGAAADRMFLAKLDDLAYDITQLLELLSQSTGSAPKPAPALGTVYLAETTFELREEREAIKRDLIHTGYEVLPDRALPLIDLDVDTMVREQLLRCTLSIHLIGRNFGVVPEGGVDSLPELQQQLASELGVGGGLTSLIWIAPDTEVEDERQRAFINHLETDHAVHETSELLRIPFEELKTQIHRKLAPPEAPAKAIVPAQQNLTRIYLLCDQEDVEATAPLADWLFAQGYEVILPVFDADETQIRIDQEESLKSADALFIYYGAASEMWLRRKLREMQKAAGLGREKPWLARAIYVGGPPSPQKDRLRTLEAMVLREPAGGFDPAILEQFTAALTIAKDVAR